MKAKGNGRGKTISGYLRPIVRCLLSHQQEWGLMKDKRLFFLLAVFILAFSLSGLPKEIEAQTPASSVKPSGLSLEDILKRLESRYSAPGFSARFFQSSTLKAMDITETASGTMTVKRPGMMRWIYEKPDKQEIITDGKQLWIYRPADNQVTIGNSPSFFGDGKGASFLSNIQSVRKTFHVTMEKMNASQEYVLKLVPMDKSYDLSSVLLVVSNDTFDIVEVVTYNSYEDETRIELSNIQIEQNLDDAQFKFTIPQGAEVVKMEG
jgi:outer membrane lipoprotein carrier protein